MKTQITARLNEPIIQDQNLIYCATVNLTWNELSDFMKGQISFKEPNAIVDFLNRRTFTKANLDNNSYLAYAALIKEGILDRIQKDLKEKFNEISRVDLNPNNYSPTDILAYSFLMKNLVFEKKFEKLDIDFMGKKVKAFGIKKVRRDTEHKLKNQVYINRYVDNDNFTIFIKSEGHDIIGLVKTSQVPTTMDEIIRLSIPKHGEPEYRLKTDESLIIPKLELDLEHHFKEMIGQTIFVNAEASEYFIADAIQFIKFLLNEEGAKLRSEMAITARKCASFQPEIQRQFIFDKPFLIYLKEEQSDEPYFVMWVANTETMKTVEAKDGI